nr:FeoA family protein [bacterium]
MPLTLASIGIPATIQHIGGKEKIRHHLESLGFTQGQAVIPISRIGGNLIVRIRDMRVAISQEMACYILIEEEESR